MDVGLHISNAITVYCKCWSLSQRVCRGFLWLLGHHCQKNSCDVICDRWSNVAIQSFIGQSCDLHDHEIICSRVWLQRRRIGTVWSFRGSPAMQTHPELLHVLGASLQHLALSIWARLNSAKEFWGASNQKKAGLKIQHEKQLDVSKLQIAVI